MIRTLVVDDEAHARKGLCKLLAGQKDFLVVGEADNGEDAVKSIAAMAPDLVLLDVEMPKLNGIEVIETVGPELMPLTVMVTAYDQYAVAAFDAAAVDYILKPFTDVRFQRALSRVRSRLDQGTAEQFGAQLRKLLDEMGRKPRAMERFTVKTGNQVSMFHVDQIDWIEADQYYAKIHIDGEIHMIRQTMMALEELLPSDRFIRIHRSTIVNLERIVALEPLFQGDHTVILRDGTRLKMSRRRKELLSDILRPLG